jgi:tetratricopeptide (TPR) repeat protein
MPEKSIAEIPRPIRELYEKGVVAFQRQNFDYAISIFSQVLQQEPSFYDCRQALRATQFKRAGESTGFLKRMWGGASASPQIAKGQLALRKNPIEALHIAEQILSGDPNSTAGQKLLAEAALGADMPKTAILSLEILYRSNPKDREVAASLADCYSRSGQVAKAESIYTDLMKVYPNDPDLAQTFKNIVAQKTMEHGGYEALESGTGSYRDILRNKDEAVSLEQEGRHVKSAEVAEKLIREYESRLENEPNKLKLMRAIAELYVQKEDFEGALRYYRDMLTLAGGTDPSIERSIADTHTKRFDFLAAQLNPASGDYEEQRKKLDEERDQVQLAEAKSRVERYPNDLQLRFELGQLYFKLGKTSEAIQELQKAQANPHRRIQAMGLLGQCFARRNMNDLAARTLQNALKEKLVFDDEKKDLLYALGTVLEKMGKVEEAIEPFKQIYEVDIGFRDVSSKVDTYYANQ